MYGEPCIKFQKLSYKRKNFYDFPSQNYLQIFAILTYFLIKNLVSNFQDFMVSQKNFYRYLKKKYLEKLKISIFLSYSKIKNSILTKTGFARAEVKKRSIFTALNVVDRHKKKTHIIVKSIHSSLRSESKTASLLMLCYEDHDTMHTLETHLTFTIGELLNLVKTIIALKRIFLGHFSVPAFARRYAAAYLMRRSRYYIAIHEGLEKCSSKQCGEADSCCSCSQFMTTCSEIIETILKKNQDLNKFISERKNRGEDT
ncbi:hypothetical protein AGLY_008746, partial [Aphis glycines]